MQQQYSSEISMHSSQEDGDEKRGSNSKRKLEVTKYMECQKNHAAGIGGHSTDGCGEFMPAGEEGTTMEALKCAACNCHRNFHKRIVTLTEEPENEPKNPDHSVKTRSDGERSPEYFFGLRSQAPPPRPPAAKARAAAAAAAVEKKEEIRDDGDRHHAAGRKRFRTKFSPDQKEKMRRFAERAGWRIQRVDESTVNQFCQEVGIKRRVLKVWMHNNKYTLASKKDSPSATSI